jgi:hypothetical protein
MEVMATSVPKPESHGPSFEVALRIAISVVLTVATAYLAVTKLDIPPTWAMFAAVGIIVGIVSPLLWGAINVHGGDISHHG